MGDPPKPPKYSYFDRTSGPLLLLAVQGGYIPVQGGYIPVQGGYIPVQGGYIPVQGGYIAAKQEMIIVVPLCRADGARTRSDQKSMIIVVPSCLKDADGARTRSDQKLPNLSFSCI